MTAAALSALCLTLPGCAEVDSVLFVTTTTIGIDADSRPPHATIGYDRYEGYIGPTYSTGAVPPVYAKIDSNLQIFNPEIRQLYATGDAARLVTQKIEPDKVDPDPKMYSGTGEVMLFGTGSNIGLRVTFAGNVPESLSLGYKRKEFSFIPLGSEDETEPDPADPNKTITRKVDRYGSVLAVMDMGVKTTSLNETGMSVTQFFATGDAARNLAAQPFMRERYALEAASAMATRPIKIVQSESGNRLAERAFADEEFLNKLVDWMARNNINTSVTGFVYGEAFEADRQRAIQELNP
jgi:hypothetical protein